MGVQAFIVSFAAAIALTGAIGCTVLENRDLCPARVMVDLSDEANTACSGLAVMAFEATGSTGEGGSGVTGWRLLQSRYRPRSEFGEPLTLEFEHACDLKIVSVDSSAAAFLSGSGLTVPLGEECPELYMHSESIHAGQSPTLCRVKVAKNFCTVRLRVTGGKTGNASDGGATEHIRICVAGNVSGCDLSGTPLPGSYSVFLPHEADISFRLPRQTDNTLSLEVYEGTSGSESTGANKNVAGSGDGNGTGSGDGNGTEGGTMTGSLLRRFALGELIARSGYDWTEDNLKDITLTLDLAATGVTLHISMWDDPEMSDIII